MLTKLKINAANKFKLIYFRTLGKQGEFFRSRMQQLQDSINLGHIYIATLPEIEEGYQDLVYRIRPYQRNSRFSCFSRINSVLEEWLDAPPKILLVFAFAWTMIMAGSQVTLRILLNPGEMDLVKSVLFMRSS